MDYADAKNEAAAAKEREVALWQEALETGQKVHPLTEEILNKHSQGPIIIEDERNNSNQEVSLFHIWPHAPLSLLTSAV